MALGYFYERVIRPPKGVVSHWLRNSGLKVMVEYLTLRGVIYHAFQDSRNIKEE